LGVVLVDIGAGTTDISVFVEGSVAYSSVLPIGARHITNDLAIGLRISLESAEKIKLFLSKPLGRRVFREEDEEESRKDEKSKEAMAKADEVDLTSLGISEEIRKVSKKTLIEGIIRPRLNEIFTMVGLELRKSGFAGQTPSGLVITGGGAATVGVSDAAKRMLAMPVRIGIPMGMKGIVDEIQNSACAASVGLLMYGSRVESQKAMPFGLSMPNIPNLKFGKHFKKVVDLVKSFIP
jgi:cell division protein FtsA